MWLDFASRKAGWLEALVMVKQRFSSGADFRSAGAFLTRGIPLNFPTASMAWISSIWSG